MGSDRGIGTHAAPPALPILLPLIFHQNSEQERKLNYNLKSDNLGKTKLFCNPGASVIHHVFLVTPLATHRTTVQTPGAGGL